MENAPSHLPCAGLVAIAETDNGPMACLRNDSGVSEKLIRYGQFAGGEIDFYGRLLRDGGTFVDIGANIGAIAVGVKRRVPSATIVGFEPQPTLFSLATINTLALPRCTVYQLAAGSVDGTVEVPEIDATKVGNYGGVALGEGGGGATGRRTFPCATVDVAAFLSRRGLVPDLIKIDVEGMEGAVLETLWKAVHGNLVLSIEADRRDAVLQYLPRLLASGARCYLSIFKNVLRSNPKFDEDDPRCILSSAHIVASFREDNSAIARLGGGEKHSEIESLDDYLSALSKIVIPTAAT